MMMNNSNGDDDDKKWTKGNKTFTGTVSRGGAFQKNFVNPSFYSSSVLVPIEKKSAFSLTISSTETVHIDNKSYTVYVIRVKSDEHTWEIIRRYKHFRVFTAKIQEEIPTISSFEFPSKKLIGNMSPQFIKQRRDQLQRFLTAIQESNEAKVSRNLKVFLDPNFSPCLKTIVCPTKEGYLYLQRKKKTMTNFMKSNWKKVYCVVINSNLFYWKKREEIYAEANGVVQLSHCIARIIERDEKKSIEINENQKNEITRENKWFLMNKKIKKKKFKLKSNSSQQHQNSSLAELDDEVYYFACDNDSNLPLWLQVMENESLQKPPQQQHQQPTQPPSSMGLPHSASQPNLLTMSSGANSSFGLEAAKGSSSSHSFLSTSSSTPSSFVNGSSASLNSNTNSFQKYKGFSPRGGDIKLGSSKFKNSNIIITPGESSDQLHEPTTKVIYNNHEFTFDNTLEDDIDADAIDLLETTITNSTIKDYMANNRSTGDTPNGTIRLKTPDKKQTTTTTTTTTSTSSSTTANTTTTSTSLNPNNNNKQLTDKLKSKGPNTEIQLYENEKVLYFTENIIHVHRKSGIVGSITITNYRFYFAAYYGSTKMAKKCEIEAISVPLAMISKITKCTTTTPDKLKYYAFELQCKDFHKLRFMHLPGSAQHKANSRLYEILESLIFKSDYFKLFCFSNDELIQEKGVNGWHVYNPLKEFERMKLPNDEFRVTHFNADYYHSPTYPLVLVVPKKITDLELIAITSFRSKGRIPVVCWKSPDSPAVMVRCSQPVVGVTGKRCPEDERLVECIALANYHTSKVFIMDARPMVNAVANQMMGMGYESTKGNSNYSGCVLKFLGIENIHRMRDSQKKLFKASMNESDTDFEMKLKKAQTVWLEHIKAIMDGSLEIVDAMRETRASVIVHCSDGWDRTSQLCALAQLVMDPSYRTIIGFQILIQKEWLSFGHKFESRIGQGSKNHKSLEYSPVFLQFIDCVWQIQAQNPDAFEFNSKYLMEIIHHLYSCRFGTFLFDSENERAVNNLSGRTTSLWSYLNQNRQHYLNSNYHEIFDSTKIHFDTSNLKLWRQYYLNWRDFHGI